MWAAREARQDRRFTRGIPPTSWLLCFRSRPAPCWRHTLASRAGTGERPPGQGLRHVPRVAVARLSCLVPAARPSAVVHRALQHVVHRKNAQRPRPSPDAQRQGRAVQARHSFFWPSLQSRPSSAGARSTHAHARRVCGVLSIRVSRSGRCRHGEGATRRADLAQECGKSVAGGCWRTRVRRPRPVEAQETWCPDSSAVPVPEAQ